MGGHLLQRTGRTGLGGTGSPAQGVFGVSCKANGGPSASENRAHRPGGVALCCVVLCCVVLRCVVLRSVFLSFCIVFFCAVLCCVVLCCVVLCCVVL